MEILGAPLKRTTGKEEHVLRVSRPRSQSIEHESVYRGVVSIQGEGPHKLWLEGFI